MSTAATARETCDYDDSVNKVPGQYYDQESGLHYNYFRDYDPKTGRYVEPDPVGTDDTEMDSHEGIKIFHLYVYSKNNPLVFADPLGLFHYKPGVPPAGAMVEAGLRCMDYCLGRDLGISGGAEQSGHVTGSKHYSGLAADISKRMNPGLANSDVMCCAKKCGFDYAYTASNRYHVQITTGLGGSHGELPKCGCDYN